MKKFAGHKPSAVIKQQCKDLGLHYNDKLYRTEGSDWVVVTSIKGDNRSGQALYNVTTGRFFGTTPRGVKFDSDSSRHDGASWFQALLAFFLIEKPAVAS